MDTVAVIDFETTGLSPDQGDRATEIAVVLVRSGRVVDRYSSLMNAGAYIPPEVQHLTGITNEMIRQAPAASKVMREAAEFVGDHPLVAHNAAFDRRFWDAELRLVGRRRAGDFVCSMLLARRVYPRAPSHRLSDLISYTKLEKAGEYHRALADAEMATRLLLKIESDLRSRYRVSEVTHELLRKIQRVPKQEFKRCMERKIEI